MQCDENPVGYFQSVLPPVPEARSGPSPRSRCFCTIWGRPRCWVRVAGRSNPALATRRRSSKAMRMRSGGLRSSIYSVLLVWSRVLSFQTHYPRRTVAPSCRFNPPRHSSFRWIGAKYQVPIDKHLRQHWSCSCVNADGDLTHDRRSGIDPPPLLSVTAGLELTRRSGYYWASPN